jgi:Ca2+/Na+ antiporter
LVIILAYLALVYYSSGIRHRPPIESSDKLLAAADARPRNFWHRRLDSIYRLFNGFKNINFKKFLANRHFWLAIFGFVLISGSSQVIVHFSAELLERWQWPQLAAGVLVFSIGTNLPEIAVTFRALVKKAGALSISHLLGSCISNVLIVGILLQFGKLTIHSVVSFGLIIVTTVLISGLFLLFYRTNKCFQRWEGVVLVAVYLAFLTSQLLWAI